MGRKLSNRPSTLGKSRKGFQQRLASRAVPKVTNNLVIQKFRLMRRNDFMVAPNTVYSEHEHGSRLFILVTALSHRQVALGLAI